MKSYLLTWVIFSYKPSKGNQTLRTQDNTAPRHFSTSAKVSLGHFGTGADMSTHFRGMA